MPSLTILPSLFVRPTTACPRCNDQQIAALSTNSRNAFTWRECNACGYLWALPLDWTSSPVPVTLRATS